MRMLPESVRNFRGQYAYLLTGRFTAISVWSIGVQQSPEFVFNLGSRCSSFATLTFYPHVGREEILRRNQTRRFHLRSPPGAHHYHHPRWTSSYLLYHLIVPGQEFHLRRSPSFGCRHRPTALQSCLWRPLRTWRSCEAIKATTVEGSGDAQVTLTGPRRPFLINAT